MNDQEKADPAVVAVKSLNGAEVSVKEAMGCDPQGECMMPWTLLSVAIRMRKVSWIIDADVENFFGNVDQSKLIRFLEHRIGDKRIIRLIQKWLWAAILEKERVKVEVRVIG